MHDGVSAMKTAVDGKKRDPALSKVGGALLGWQGAWVGEKLSRGLSMSGALKSGRDYLKGKLSGEGAHELMKGLYESLGGDPCDCE